jgi:Flp pilus assembly protein TadD/O-antigen ligase
MARKRPLRPLSPSGSGRGQGLTAFGWHEYFLLGVALIPLVFMPWVLDLYDLPKKACLNLLILMLVSFHTLSAVRRPGGVFLAMTPITWPAVAYLAGLILSSIGCLNSTDAINGLLQQGLPVLLCLVLVTRGLAATATERFVSTAIFAGSVATVVGLAQSYGLSTDAYGIRQAFVPGSLFGNKNMAAEFTLFILPLVLYRCEKDAFRGLHPFVAVMILLFLGLTQTKAAWIGAVVILLLTGIRLRGLLLTKAQLFRAVRIVCLPIAFLCLINIPHRVGERIERRLQVSGSVLTTAKDSVNNRVPLWLNSSLMIARHPLFGVGPDNWYIHYPRYALAVWPDPTFDSTHQEENPHSDTIKIAAETGLAGLAAFFWIVATLARLAWRNSCAEPSPGSDLKFYASLSILAILLDGLFAFPLHLAPGAGLFWALAAVLVAGSPGVIPKLWRLPGGWAVGGLIVIVCVGLMVREVRIVESNRHHRDGAIEVPNNDFRSAAEHFRQSIALDSRRYRTHAALGLCLLKQGHLAESFQEYSLALQCHPNEIGILGSLAHIRGTQGKLDEAILLLHQALDIFPNFREGHYLLSGYHTQKGDHGEAIRMLNRLLKVEPRNTYALNQLGNLHRDLKQYKEAEGAYLEALKFKPNYGEVRNNLGVLYLRQGQYAEAANFFKTAIQQTPDYAGSYFNLARAETSLGHITEAEEAYKKFLSCWTGDDATRKSAEAEMTRLRQPPAADPKPAEK